MLQSFFHIFPKRIEEESLKVELSLVGVTGTYVFVEYYCLDPSCDCCKVTLIVRDKNFNVLATIGYWWESVKFYQRWGLLREEAQELVKGYLDPMQAQSQYAKAFLQLFREVAMQDELVEPMSLDEAYLDVTHNKTNNPSATWIAQEIKQKIFLTTGLTASAGVSYNKFLAKMASDVQKPDGLTVITPKEAASFIESLKIRDFYGVGKATEKKMHALGIFTGKDLKTWRKLDLIKHFGKTGNYYHDIAHGLDDRPVDPNRERKPIGAEYTFPEDVSDAHVIL